MGIHIPRMPCLALLLLLLLLNLPISMARSLQYHDPGWKLFQRRGKGSSIADEQQIQGRNWNQAQLGDDCQGIFDLYIILDKSGSVGRNWIYVYSFTEDLVKKFQNPKLRMSIITYSTYADVIIPLTSDREAIRKGLAILHEEVPEGFTHMQDGFKKANEQIRKASQEGSNVQSVIIAMTDGLLLDKHFKQTLEEANISRQLGATVLTAGVYHYDKWQMAQVADSPDHTFEAKQGFTALQDIVDKIASKSCIQVFSVKPSYVCTKDAYQVSINGRGFKNAKDLTQVICRFTFSDSRVVDESPTEVNDNTINCPGPKIQHTGEEVSLEVSLNNGISFIGNRLVITGNNCGSTKGALLSSHDISKSSSSSSGDISSSSSSGDISSSSSSGDISKSSSSRSNAIASKPQAKDPDTVPVHTTQGEVNTTPNKLGGRIIFNWTWLFLLPVLLVAIMLLICCCRLCCKKPKEPPSPPPPPQPEKDPEENLPPPTSPPTPSPPPPPTTPSPSPVNPNPTVIVACCGCGNRGGHLDTCCSYFYPSCHQMPLMCCHSKVQGQCNNTTVVNPSCLCSGRDCVPITQQPCTTRIVLQPNRECFNVSQTPCNRKVCLPTSPEGFPIEQNLCSKMCLPHKERYLLNYSESPCTNRCHKTPSRVLPLLPPHIRKSVESVSHTHPFCPPSKQPK